MPGPEGSWECVVPHPVWRVAVHPHGGRWRGSFDICATTGIIIGQLGQGTSLGWRNGRMNCRSPARGNELLYLEVGELHGGLPPFFVGDVTSRNGNELREGPAWVGWRGAWPPAAP